MPTLSNTLHRSEMVLQGKHATRAHIGVHLPEDTIVIEAPWTGNYPVVAGFEYAIVIWKARAMPERLAGKYRVVSTWRDMHIAGFIVRLKRVGAT